MERLPKAVLGPDKILTNCHGPIFHGFSRAYHAADSLPLVFPADASWTNLNRCDGAAYRFPMNSVCPQTFRAYRHRRPTPLVWFFLLPLVHRYPLRARHLFSTTKDA